MYLKTKQALLIFQAIRLLDLAQLPKWVRCRGFIGPVPSTSRDKKKYYINKIKK